jgi:hypothetical protein
MDTKNRLLTLTLRAARNSDKCASELFNLLAQAIRRTDAEEIEWHQVNDMLEQDSLLIIALTNVDLTINFSEVVIREAVRYVFREENIRYH